MIKRLIVAAIAVVFFVLQFNLNGASALELNEKTLTITLNDAGESVTLTSDPATEGQKLF
ncbi:MAG: cytochrome c-550, partial [Microcystis sp.]